MSETDRAGRYVRWLLSHRRFVVIAACVLGVLSGTRTVLTYANLRSDLEELLPKSAPSVHALEVARRRLPGLRHLGVVVETGGKDNVGAASRFLADLAKRVRAYGPEVVEDVRLGVRKERAFAETYALQLMDPSDVVRLRKAVEERRDWEVTRASGMDLLDEDEDPPPALPLEELQKKYAARYGTAGRDFPDDRFISEDGEVAVMVVQVGGQSTGVGADEALLERVRADVAALGFPEAYAEGMRLGFAGDVPTRVEEMEGLVADLSLSGLLVTTLVVLVIVGFFRSGWALPILGVPLALGSLSAFGLVALPPLGIRHLNSNTAFLGSIVVGNGINTGIILLARYQEERASEVAVVESIATAVRSVWRPTLAAATAASAAYGSLIVTDFRGFNQFGWIGGLGMLACWASTLVLSPILIERWGSGIRRSRRASRPSPIAGLGLTLPRTTVLVALGLSIVSVVGIAGRTSDWLETDFSKLRRKDSWVDGERYWGRQMNRTLGRYLTPTVILSEDRAQARAAAERVNELAVEDRAGGLIASVRSVDSVLPPERSRSIAEAQKLKEILTPRLKGQLDPDERVRVERALSPESFVPLEPEDIPKVFAAGLRERDGTMGRNVLVYPKLTRGTWDASRMAAFTEDLRRAASPDGTVPVAGSLLLSTDIVSAMKADGPRATAVALGIVLVVAALAFRSFGLSLSAIASLIVGVLLMLGGLAWAGQRFNFSNFVALPITFGIAADYSINMLKRFQTDGAGDPRAAVASTGGAVALCSATTVIGFGSLLVAQNQALFSFGVFAVVGELACLATAVWALPAVISLVRRDGRESV